MRNTRKIALALAIVMVIAMTLAIIPASAETPTTLYLTPSANWKADGARFAAYFFGNGETWVSMTDADKDGVYEVTVPAGYPNVIFCRMNPNASANNWNNKWNQTADLTIPTSGANHYAVKEGTWDKGGGTWSTYGSTCTHANLGPEATCTTSQDCLDCKDPVVSALGHTYNSSHLCTRCNGQATFTVAGSGAHLGTEWDTGNTANDMTYADGVYTKVYTNVAAGSYMFKVARDHDWGTAYPDTDKAYTVATAGSTVTITLKGTTVDVKVEAPHTHNFVEGKCECGESDPNYVPPHEHNFVDGKCECGEEDPNYVPPVVEPAKPIVNISDLTIETTVDGELIAGTGISASAGLSIDANNKSIDGFDFTKRLKLGGTMKIEDGVVKAGIQVVTNGPAKIIVYAISSSSSDSSRTLQLASVVDGALVKLAETAGVDGASIAKYELSVDAAGTYYIGSTKSGINVYYIAVEAVEAPAHVNSLVVGDTNKIVVSGNFVNAYNLPIEWVPFVAEEKAHYEFIGDDGVLAMIFSADGTSLLCGGTGKADLEAGTYLICVGNGLVGEFNVAVTKTAIEEPVAPQYNWWVSDSTLYSAVDGHIVYNGAGNTYACVGCDVAALAAGNNTFTITITNNGSAASRVRVDIQAVNQVGNHKVVNTGAVGGDVWTDMEWGGSVVTVPAGESVTLVITYDENTERGAVKDLIIFADSGRGDDAAYSADITVSDMAFSKVSDEPADYTNTLVVGDNNVTIGHKAIDNGYGYLMETVVFTADAKAHYKFAGEGLTILVYDLSMNNLCGFTGEADLDAGMYIICFAANTIGTTGEYSISVTKSEISDEPVVEPELPALNLGDNTVVIDGTQTNLLGKAIAWYTFTPETAGAYQFSCSDLTVYILTSQNMADVGAYIGSNGIADLEAGVMYYILVGKDGVTGEFAVNVAAYEGEKPHINTVVLGDNTYIVSDALLGTGYEFIGIEITAPGTYCIKGGAPLTIFFFTVPGTLDTSSPYEWNIDNVTYEYIEEFYVTLAEAGTYWVGFRYDNIGETREFNYSIAAHEHTFEEGKCVCGAEDPNYVPPHEHNFVEGKCECGETDPNYVAPEQPEPETPADPQPEPELNFFQQIIKAITDFFAKIGDFFKNLFAK